MPRSALTLAIDEAIDLVQRNDGVDLTPEHVAANLRVRPDDIHSLEHGALIEAIRRRMKGRDLIITDADERAGGRPRDGYYDTGLSEHKQQLRVQAENGRFTQNRIAAEQAVIEFMEARTTDLGYEPPWLTIAEDVERIYRMNGATPPGVSEAA